MIRKILILVSLLVSSLAAMTSEPISNELGLKVRCSEIAHDRDRSYYQSDKAALSFEKGKGMSSFVFYAHALEAVVQVSLSKMSPDMKYYASKKDYALSLAIIDDNGNKIEARTDTITYFDRDEINSELGVDVLFEKKTGLLTSEKIQIDCNVNMRDNKHSTDHYPGWL